MINHKSAPMKNPLIVALDVDEAGQALKLADQLKDVVGGFKLGPRLCLRYGSDFVQKMAKFGPIFLDNKHLDIPSTMEAAVRASFEAGASLVTVHATSGMEALQRMARVEAELSARRPFKVLAVTILTSWDQSSLPPIFKDQALSSSVLDLVQLTCEAGLSSVVCSPHELPLILQNLQNTGLYLVTPGIRTSMDANQDQKRIMGPQEALQLGASALVVGRPIIEAQDPVRAAAEFLGV